MWKQFRIIAALVFVLIIILRLSDCFHNSFSANIIDFLYQNIGFVSIAICILDVFTILYNIKEIQLKEKMNAGFNSVLLNLRERFYRCLTRNKMDENLSCSTLGQLLVAFYNDEEIFQLIIRKLYEYSTLNDDYLTTISYLFLENEQDNDFVEFFDKNPSAKNKFIDVSSTITNNFVEDVYNADVPITSKYSIYDILISLRHMCLPQNYISKQELIYVCRMLLDVMLNELKKTEFENNVRNISLFLTSLTLLERKIISSKISNKQIDEKLKSIKDDVWTKKAINEAYKNVYSFLINNADAQYEHEQIAYCASLLSIYNDKLSTFQKSRLHIAVNRFNSNISSSYNKYTDEKIALLLACSSIFSGINNQQNLFDEAISLAYLCSSNTNSLLSKIVGGSK